MITTELKPHLRELSQFVESVLAKNEKSAFYLASVSGLGKSTVYGVLNGHHDPTLQTLKKLASGLSRIARETITANQLSNLVRGDALPSTHEEPLSLVDVEQYLLTAPPNVVAHLSVLCAERLKSEVRDLIDVSSGRTMQVHRPNESLMSSTQSLVSYMLLGTLEREQLSRVEFVDLAGDDLTLARFDQIADKGAKPTELEYKALVRALRSCGQNWHWTMLDRLYSTPITKPIDDIETNNS